MKILAGSLGRPFASADEATEALCRMLSGLLRKPPLAAGRAATMGGRRVTVDGCGGSKVGFRVARRLLD